MVRAAISRVTDERVETEMIELAEPGPHEVQVRVLASAIDKGDKWMLARAPKPALPSHSAYGIVEAVGAGVMRCGPGQHVAITGTMECGLCRQCLRGRHSQCERLWELTLDPPTIAHAVADGAAIRSVGAIGSMAERTIVSEWSVAVVEVDVDPAELALLGCGGISGYGAVIHVGGVKPGDSVVIVGAGHLGLWMTQSARLAGASPIIVVEPLASRRATATLLGATHVIDPAAGPVKEQVFELTGGLGADVALEAAGSYDAMRELFHLAGNGGVIVHTSVDDPADALLDYPALSLVVFGKQIRGSQSGAGYVRRDVPLIAKLLESGELDAGPIVTQRFGLDEYQDALDSALALENLTGVVVL